MTATILTDGRVLHLPGAPLIPDSYCTIVAPADAELASIVPLIRPDDLLLFSKRLISGTCKRRWQPRWQDVNRARMELARLCIERVLAEQFN